MNPEGLSKKGGNASWSRRLARGMLYVGVLIVVHRVSGCSYDHDVLCLAGYELKAERDRPEFSLLTLSSRSGAENRCWENGKAAFESCVVQAKNLCTAYHSGKKVAAKYAGTDEPVGEERLKRNMQECKGVMEYDGRKIPEEMAYSWWVDSCSYAHSNAYDACLDDKGFAYEMSPHLRCKALNIIH